MKSDAIKLGPGKAAQRSLLKALGLTDEKIKSNDKPQKEEVTEQKSNSSKNKKSKKER